MIITWRDKITDIFFNVGSQIHLRLRLLFVNRLEIIMFESESCVCVCVYNKGYPENT